MPYYRCASCGLIGYSAPRYATASVCPNCSAELGEATRVRPTPWHSHTTRDLAAHPESAAAARRVVVALPFVADLRDRLALIVSELVTNAIVHGCDGPSQHVSLEVIVRRRRIVIEVCDGGGGFDPLSPRNGSPVAAGGRGLMIVAALAARWGVVRNGDGCAVWCEVPVEDHELAAEPELSLA